MLSVRSTESVQNRIQSKSYASSKIPAKDLEAFCYSVACHPVSKNMYNLECSDFDF
jgi:hypothetical protein